MNFDPDAEDWIKVLEARCAQLVSLGEWLATEFVDVSDHHPDDCPEDGGGEDCQNAARIHAALTPDVTQAAAAFVERIRAEEREVIIALLESNVIKFQIVHAARDIVAAIRARSNSTPVRTAEPDEDGGA